MVVYYNFRSDSLYFINEKNVNCSKAISIIISDTIFKKYLGNYTIVKNYLDSTLLIPQYVLINSTINTNCDFSKKRLKIETTKLPKTVTSQTCLCFASNFIKKGNFIEKGNYIENLLKLTIVGKMDYYPDIRNINFIDINKYDVEIFKKYNFESISITKIQKRKIITNKKIILGYEISKLKSLKIKNFEIEYYISDKVKDRSYSIIYNENFNKYLNTIMNLDEN